MLRSKSRSGSFSFRERSNSSVLTRTISASRFCRGDALVSQIDTDALISVERKPTKRFSKLSNLSKDQIEIDAKMQEQISAVKEEQERMKEQLAMAEEERDRALRELWETKEKLGQALSPSKAEEKESLSSSKQELEKKEKAIEALKIEAEKAKQLEMKFAEKDEMLRRLKEESIQELDEKKKLMESLKIEGEKTKQLEMTLAEKDEMLCRLKEESKQVLGEKDNIIESLKVEVEKGKQAAMKIIAEKDEMLQRLKEEFSSLKASETQVMNLLSESEKRIEELETEVKNEKQSGSKIFESLASQTKQLEQTKIGLEESKIEIASLHEMLEKLGYSSKQSSLDNLNVSPDNEEQDTMKAAFESPKTQLRLAKESLANAQDSEKHSLENAKCPVDEIEVLKNELKLSIEAEEESKKAMDDLALALNEVATEASMLKEKLGSTQLELEHVKRETEHLKSMVSSTEDIYHKRLEDANKETELYKNTSERLRLEAEEAYSAWNGKEMGFVSCIKRAEDEKVLVQHENAKLAESVKKAEAMTRSAREETYKLRDILKQALNEANVAKEAASIAKDENSQLKDSLVEKEEAMLVLTQEIERVRINEAAAHEIFKEFKRLPSVASTDLKLEDKEQRMFWSPSSVHKNERPNAIKKGFSFDLNELKMFNEPYDFYEDAKEEDPEKAEALKGSIFDAMVSPKSEARTPVWSHSRRSSSPYFVDDSGKPNSEVDHSDHLDDADHEMNSQRRRSALAQLRRFGDLIMKKGFHRKESLSSPE